MTNHPNRPTASFRYIAFSTVDHQPLARAATPAEARDEAVSFNRLDDAAFIEVIDCGDEGRKIWSSYPLHPISLTKLRARHRVVFRGDGYDHLPPVEL